MYVRESFVTVHFRPSMAVTGGLGIMARLEIAKSIVNWKEKEKCIVLSERVFL